MKKTIITAAMLSALAWPCLAQQKTTFNPADLGLNFEVVSKNEHGQTTAVLSLKNLGKTTLPASGWSIYFNSRALKTAGQDSLMARVKHVNGDLFRLVPLKGFKTINPGKSLDLQITANDLNNKTEFPGGFYMVWDATPEKGYNLKNTVIKARPIYEKSEQELAAIAYRENQLIKDIPATQLPGIFPSPLNYVAGNGSFTLDAAVHIVANGDFEAEANVLAGDLSKLFGKSIAVSKNASGRSVVFQKADVGAAEAYELTISPEQVLIKAGDAAGAFYGIQSLKSLWPATAFTGTQAVINLSAATVKDAPRFGFRAFMMDVARNFLPKKEVLKVLDLMALYKLNVFHFHLNDDEGWRIEIKGLPELTEVGSRRGHTLKDEKSILPSYGSGADHESNAGTGFYTREDYIEILKYATARHIRVIPEIETPGHARAAIKSMDVRYARLIKAGQKAEAERYLLRDLNDQSQYRSVQGFNDNVVNAALPSVYNFMEKVTDELIEMHQAAAAPLATVHFGGDEVPAGVWEKSPAVAALLKKDRSIEGVDDLWHYYFSKINAMLKKRNLYLSGWEEIGLHKAVVNGVKKMVPEPRFIGENFHADVWNNLTGNEDLAYKMANAGYKVVLTLVTNFYIDLAANRSFEERGQYWGGYVGIDKPYYFIPYEYYKNVKEDEEGNPVDLSIFKDKVRLTETGKANIVGLQSPLWSETIRNTDHFEYMLLPRLLAFAERTWAKDPEWATTSDAEQAKTGYSAAWSEFMNIVGKRELPRLTGYAGGFLYRIPTAGAFVNQGKVAVNVQYPGFVIRYTTDGTEPTASSQLYETEIPLNGTVKLRVFDQAGRGGRSISIKP